MRASRAKLIALRLVVPITLMVFFAWLERALPFHPHPAPTDVTIASRVPGLELWWHESPEGPVEAWFVPGELPLWLAPYRAMGISVPLPEYRGDGRSQGAPTERGIREDLVALHDRSLKAAPAVTFRSRRLRVCFRS